MHLVILERLQLCFNVHHVFYNMQLITIKASEFIISI